MAQLFRILNLIVSIYMILIFIRIMLTWFSGMGSGGLLDVLSRITDPYLNWFRRFSFLRVGFLDLSPIAALGVLSLFSRVLGMIVFYGRITIGIILALMLQTLWGALSFILIFLIAVLVIRLVGYLLKQNSSSPFWNVIYAISQPVLNKINGYFLKGRIVNSRNSLIVTIAGLGVIYFALRFFIAYVSLTLARLPF